MKSVDPLPQDQIRIQVSSYNRPGMISTEERSSPLQRLLHPWRNAEQYSIDALSTLDLTRWHPPVDKSKGKGRGDEITKWTFRLNREKELHDWETSATARIRKVAEEEKLDHNNWTNLFLSPHFDRARIFITAAAIPQTSSLIDEQHAASRDRFYMLAVAGTSNRHQIGVTGHAPEKTSKKARRHC